MLNNSLEFKFTSTLVFPPWKWKINCDAFQHSHSLIFHMFLIAEWHYQKLSFYLCVVCVCVCVCVCAQLCPTLCDLLDCRFSGSSVHGIFQAKILEWVTTSSSRRSSQPRDWTHVSCISFIGRQILYHWATWEVPSFIYYSNRHLTTLVTWPFFFFEGELNNTHNTCQFNGKKICQTDLASCGLIQLTEFSTFQKKISYFYAMQMQPKFWSQNCWVQERLLKAEKPRQAFAFSCWTSEDGFQIKLSDILLRIILTHIKMKK